MLAILALEEICFPGLRIVGMFPPTDSVLYYPLIFLLTIIQMAFYLVVVAMLASMMADVAEIRELASGEREEGTIYSAQMLTLKTGSALGVWIAGFVLELVAFPTAVEAIAVAPETAHNLVLTLILVYLAIYPIALVCIWRIRVSRASHRINLEQLQLGHPVSRD
jgi:Na+/melibiose symporter-like transporter